MNGVERGAELNFSQEIRILTSAKINIVKSMQKNKTTII